MQFNSVDFILFFPIVVIIYWAIPERLKNIFLLIASYYFYMCWNAAYGLLLFFCTLVTYIGAILIEKSRCRYSGKGSGLNSRSLLGVFAAIIIAVLMYFKYCNFFIQNINYLLGITGSRNYLSTFNILLPVGISFFTFQSLGYLIDVYRQNTQAEHNLIDYALFVSFFPQLVAGPIERSKNLLKQIKTSHSINFHNMQTGALMMVWGYFMKLVIADRAAIFIDRVFTEPENHGGSILICAVILFAFQIYCDFNGYTMIARGAAQMMGYNLMENFDAPYLATSVTEFWRKWHISLTGWFRDYVYIPMGGNRKGKTRKYLNLLAVFLLSGLWHGADWSFVLWGGLNGLYQIIEDFFKLNRNYNSENTHSRSVQSIVSIVRCLFTFILVDFTWLFFRAGSIGKSVSILKNLIHLSPVSLFDGTLFAQGLDKPWFMVLIISIIILLVGDLLKKNGLTFYKIVNSGLFIKCFLFIFLVLYIFVFGVFGAGYDVGSFIYFRF